MTSKTDATNGRTDSESSGSKDSEASSPSNKVSEHLDGNPERVLSDPMTDREETIMRANNRLNGHECPNEDCEKTVDVCDLTDDGELYIVHESDPEPSTQTRGHDAGRCSINPDDVDEL